MCKIEKITYMKLSKKIKDIKVLRIKYKILIIIK